MTAEEMEGMVCPVPLPRPKSQELVRAGGGYPGRDGGARTLARAGPGETGGRSLVGVSGLEIDEVLVALDRMIASRSIQSAGTLSAAQTLRYTTEDLRNWYLEAASAKPGGNTNSEALADWFWGATSAGALVLALHPIGLSSDDPVTQRVAGHNLIPRQQKHRLA